MGVKSTLKIAFWKFLVLLIVGLIISFMVTYLVLSLSINMGVVTSANSLESRVNAIVPVVENSPNFSEVELPLGTKYLVINKEYDIISTDMSDIESEKALNYATTGGLSGATEYRFITRDCEYVILQYSIKAQFTNEWLNKYLPTPDILAVIIMLFSVILVCVVLTTRFSKNLRQELSPLFEATKEISEQNLDFQIGHSKIKEFDDVLYSFDHMKTSLKASLEEQWNAQQIQKEQIAALAHDLKTPLTVIQGNADLMCETPMDDEQKMFAEYIINSSNQMEKYIKILIDISKTSQGYELRLSTIDVREFVLHIEVKIKALCQTRGIVVNYHIKDTPKYMCGDEVLLERAIMNVVHNAVDFTGEDKEIYIDIFTETDMLKIAIIDTGTGFCDEDLKYAKKQFYMADNSRSRNTHFGMGLYIADQIVVNHGGRLTLENDDVHGGARVVISVSIE